MIVSVHTVEAQTSKQTSTTSTSTSASQTAPATASATASAASPMSVGGDAVIDVYNNDDTINGPSNGSISHTFYLLNSGTGGATVYYYLTSVTGPLSGCSLSASQAYMAANGEGNVTVSCSTGLTGTGSVTMRANWGSGLNANGNVTVHLPGAQPLVTASPTTEWTQQNVSTGFPYFTIKNTGNTAATYNLTAHCTNVADTCSVASPTVSVAPNGTTTAEVRFTTGPASGGNETAMLTATSPYGEKDSTTVTIVPMSEYVSVAAQTALEPPPPVPGGSATYGFTITATGNNTSSVTYGLTATCTGALSCSTTPSPGSVTISPSSPATATVLATATNSAGGVGAVTITALYTDPWGNPYSNSGTYADTLPDRRTYTPVVTRNGDSVSYTEANISTSYTFLLRNSGDTQASYTLTTPTCTGAVSGCSIGTSNPITVNGGATVSVPVNFTTGAAGQIVHLDLHATMTAHDTTFADDGTAEVVPTTPAVQVTASDGRPGVSTYGSGSYHFMIDDIGNATPVTYALQVTGCTAPLTNCTVQDSITVANGTPQTVAVSYQTASTPGTGTITLRAYKQDVHLYESSDSGNIDVTSRVVALTPFMNNDDQDVNLCAASCFAMTASRSTVPYYTLDTPRSVTLVYNGDRAFPRPFIYADVAVSNAPAAVQSYTLEVWRMGARLLFTNGDSILTFAGTSSPATWHRLAGQVNMSSYPTDADSVTLKVTAHYANDESDVTQATTQLMTVNSASSSIAKGWMIGGLQYLRQTPRGLGLPGWLGGGYMIENGDGSATYFGRVGESAEDFSTLTFDSVATWTRTYQDGSKVLFDLSGKMTTAIDRLGRQTQFHYDAQSRLDRITEPMRTGGSSTVAPYLSLSYDANGLSSITETGGANGRTTSVTVDGSGHLTRITDPDGGYDSYGYDGSGRLHTITDRRGNTTTYNYDPAWKLSQIVSPSVLVDAGGGTTTAGTPTTNIAAWQEVGVPFDTTANNPAPLLNADTIAARITDPKGYVSTLFPDRWGQALKTVDALGNTTVIQRNGWILPTVVTHPDGSVDSASYSASGGLLLSQRLAGQQRVSYTYGNMNQLLTVSGAGVVSVTNTLDSLGRVRKTAYGTVLGDTTEFTYDPVTKNVATMLRADSGMVQYSYDARFGNLAADTTPGGRGTQVYFDSYGRDTATKAPQYPMTKTVYDVLNRVTAQYDGHATNPVMIGYDAILPVSVRDQRGNVDSTEYDALGRATRHFGYASSTIGTTVRYDLDSRPTSTTNRRGQRIDLTYDPLDRVLSKTGGNNETTTDTFTYSTNGLIQTATNTTSAIRTVSVPGGLLDTVQTTLAAPGVTHHTYTVVHYHSPNAGGIDSTAISSDGAPAQFVTRRYVKDASNGTLKTINLGLAIGHGDFSYDAAGRRDSTSWPTGISETDKYLSTGGYSKQRFQLGLGAHSSLAYRVDSAGRIRADSRVLNSSSAPDTTNRIFGYDALGHYTGTTDVSDYSWTCADHGGRSSPDPDYGSYGCLIDDLPAPSVYSYDDAGNRADPGDTLGVGDQMRAVSYSGMHLDYTYDADGNVITRFMPLYDVTWSYHWSSDNRLLDGGSAWGGTESFDYDALGQPIVMRNGSNGQIQRVTLYDGGNILADLDSVGNRQAEYVYNAGTDHPYVLLTGAGTVTGAQYFVLDAFGNVQGTVIDSVTPGQSVTYDDWGDVATVSGDTTNRLMWKGLPIDSRLWLSQMRARWYDPVLGRFISEDPIGLAGGINPYVFADNDPVNGSDPNGEDSHFVNDGGCQYSYNTATPDDVTYDFSGCGFGFVGDGMNSFLSGVPFYLAPDASSAKLNHDGHPHPKDQASHNRDVGDIAVQQCQSAIIGTTIAAVFDITGAAELRKGFTSAKFLIRNVATNARLPLAIPDVLRAGAKATLRRSITRTLATYTYRSESSLLVGDAINFAWEDVSGSGHTWWGYVPIPGAATLAGIKSSYQACNPE